jgi:hypothetical protein
MFVGIRVANPQQVDNLPHVRTALIHSGSAFLLQGYEEFL